MKLNLTYIQRTERTAKASGKPFTSLSIKAKEYGDKFLSGFGNRANADWKEGMEVEVAEVKEVVKDGKTYLNFEMPKAFNGNPEVQKALEEIRGQNTKILLMLTEIGKAVVPQPKDIYKELGIPEEVTPPNFEPTVNIGDERATPDDEFAGLDEIAETL